MSATTAYSSPPERAPSVLVVLAVRDAAEWLRECLQALAVQTYPRVGVLAVDDASTDGSNELLVQALGEGRVLRHDTHMGLSRSFDEAVAHPVAAEADFILLLHDDAVLDPEAVARLVEATMLAGAERVGIVGAKIVDWDHPRRLRDVGRSADLFGHPYSALQAEEIDQGQFDRVLEVLSVDSCAMLVAREVWQTSGLFDERLGDDDGDLDL
ncbi:MAG: glycosyltransferase family 2 protein, partial [Myxococcales bacterium]